MTSRRPSQGPHGPAAPLPEATAPLAQYLRRAKQRLGSPEPAPEPPAGAPRNSARAGLLTFALLLCCFCGVAALLAARSL